MMCIDIQVALPYPQHTLSTASEAQAPLTRIQHPSAADRAWLMAEGVPSLASLRTTLQESQQLLVHAAEALGNVAAALIVQEEANQALEHACTELEDNAALLGNENRELRHALFKADVQGQTLAAELTKHEERRRHVRLTAKVAKVEEEPPAGQVGGRRSSHCPRQPHFDSRLLAEMLNIDVDAARALGNLPMAKQQEVLRGIDDGHVANRSAWVVAKVKRSSPYYRCIYYARGDCWRGAACPYEHGGKL